VLVWGKFARFRLLRTVANRRQTLTHCKNQPITIPLDGMDGLTMQKVEVLRPKGGETEKITINLGPIDLGQIDLLVEEGFIPTART